jgi:hypothetical protein
MDNPWAPTEHNLSAFERNRILLNNRQGAFVDVSHLTGADSDADSRSVTTADINGDGMQDLLVRSSGGGAVQVFLNRITPQHWLKVSLRGSQSNSLGIGARLVATVGNRDIPRQLYPVGCFRAQQPSHVYFGLSSAEKVDSLTITWPSGKTQVLKDVVSNRHILIREGSDKIEPIAPTKHQ